MRCAEAIRELTIPTPGADPGLLARHLADCPDCCSRAAAESAFDRAWDAGRPEPPTERDWQRLWGNVSTAAEIPAVLPLHPRQGFVTRNAYWLAVAAVAQAAAVLVAAAILLQGGRNVGTASTDPVTGQGVAAQVVSAVAPTYEFEINADQTLILEVGAGGDTIVCKPRWVNTDDLVAYDLEETADPSVEALAFSSDILSTMENLD